MKRNARRAGSKTPVRAGLLPNSVLQNSVCDGLGALKRDLRRSIHADTRELFADSLDLDAALTAEHPSKHRWDYLLGHTAKRRIVAVEVHSADTSEVSVVIDKKKAAMLQLQAHLAAGAQVSKWIWVSSGRVGFLPFEKCCLRLSQNGIDFAGTELQNKHLA
jgi:hypothetical protein